MKTEQEKEEFEEMMKEYDDFEKTARLYDEFEKIAGQGNPEPTRVVDKAVNQPSHYDVVGMSVNDIIAKSFTHDEYMGWLRGNIIKYKMRSFKKGNSGMQDVKKADMYQKFYDDYIKQNTP